ncbi:MAG: tetratricopeptide repeat protein [Prevotella sp.]|nr:tetratricopeptide repeat protein [Prevotella sp.]
MKTTYRLIGLAAAMAAIMAACTLQPTDRIRSDNFREMKRIQDSLKLGRTDYAQEQIGRRLAEAADSDYYYLWMGVRAKLYFTTMNVDSFLLYNTLMGQYLQRTPDNGTQQHRELRTEWLIERGAYFASMVGQLDSAIDYNRQALQTMQTLHPNVEYKIMALTNLADIYRQNGQPDLSADTYLRALETADSARLGADTYIIIYQGISSVYSAMGDFTESRRWWERTAELIPQMTKNDLFLYYNNRGNDYYQQQRYDEARQCFETVDSMLSGDEQMQWDRIFARTNLADVYIQLGEVAKARPLTEEAEAFFRRVGFGIPLYYTDTQQMLLSLLEGRTAEAYAAARQSHTPEGMLPEQRVMRLRAISRIMEAAQDWHGALEANKQLTAIGDSIQRVNTQMQLSARLLQYEHDKRISAQQRQIERHEWSLRMVGAILIAALLALALLLLLFRAKRRQQRLRDLTTRQRMMELRMENARNRITPHFVYNALTHEMLAEREGRKPDLTALTYLLRRGVEQADVTETTLKEELDFIDYYVDIEGRLMGDDFCYDKRIADDVDTEAVKLPSMLIQIFVENAIKHGLRPVQPEPGRQRRLTVSASRQGAATLVEVSDNGRGLPAHRAPQEHTGMRIVRQTIQMLNEHNTVPIRFGVEPAADGAQGCRSWMLLPDGYVPNYPP